MRFLLYSLIFLFSLNTTSAQDRLNIVTSIPPLTSLIRSIVKSKGSISSILDRKMDHHLVELKPSDVVGLSRADIIFLNGLGLETWARSLPKEIAMKTVTIFHLKDTDVHAWLSPTLIVESIPQIVTKLCEMQNESCDEFKKNGEHVASEIIRIRDNLRERSSKLSQRGFLAEHPTWSLFAKDIGVNQISTLRRTHEDTLTIKDIASFSKEAKNLKKRLFLIEPSTPRNSIKSLSDDLSLEVLELDPLGNGTEDYGVFIQRNADKLLSALEKE